jgi:hypothetical protein
VNAILARLGGGTKAQGRAGMAGGNRVLQAVEGAAYAALLAALVVAVVQDAKEAERLRAAGPDEEEKDVLEGGPASR